MPTIQVPDAPAPPLPSARDLFQPRLGWTVRTYKNRPPVRLGGYTDSLTVHRGWHRCECCSTGWHRDTEVIHPMHVENREALRRSTEHAATMAQLLAEGDAIGQYPLAFRIRRIGKTVDVPTPIPTPIGPGIGQVLIPRRVSAYDARSMAESEAGQGGVTAPWRAWIAEVPPPATKPKDDEGHRSGELVTWTDDDGTVHSHTIEHHLDDTRRGRIRVNVDPFIRAFTPPKAKSSARNGPATWSDPIGTVAATPGAYPVGAWPILSAWRTLMVGCPLLAMPISERDQVKINAGSGGKAKRGSGKVPKNGGAAKQATADRQATIVAPTVAGDSQRERWIAAARERAITSALADAPTDPQARRRYRRTVVVSAAAAAQRTAAEQWEREHGTAMIG